MFLGLVAANIARRRRNHPRSHEMSADVDRAGRRPGLFGQPCESGAAAVTFYAPQRASFRTTTWFNPSAQGRSACGPTLGKTPPQKHAPLLRFGGEGQGERRSSYHPSPARTNSAPRECSVNSSVSVHLLLCIGK